MLEKKIASEHANQIVTPVPAVSKLDAEELEVLAQKVVDYKARLKRTSGYTNKSLKEDEELAKIGDRLDHLVVFLLRPQQIMEEHGPVPAAPNALIVRERQLARRLARHETGLSPSEAREVELLVNLAERKAYLRRLTKKEQDKDEEVMRMLIRLQEIRENGIHDKKRAKSGNEELEADFEELAKLEDDLQALKREMKAEKHCTNKDIKHRPVLGELEERLSVLRRFGGA